MKIISRLCLWKQTIIAMAHDIFLAVASILLGIVLRFEDWNLYYNKTEFLVLFVSAIILQMICFYLHGFCRGTGVPRSIFVIDWLQLIVSLGGGRLSYRLLRSYVRKRELSSGEKMLNSFLTVTIGE